VQKQFKTMVKRIFSIILFYLLAATSLVGQESHIDSIKFQFNNAVNDTTRMILSGMLADEYSEINPDSSYVYGNKMLDITKRLSLKLDQVFALGTMGYAQLNLGNYPRSLQLLLSAVSLAEDKRSEKNVLPASYAPNDEFTDRTLTPNGQRILSLSRIYQYLGILYVNSGNYNKSKNYYYLSIPLAAQFKNHRLLSIIYSTLGRTYLVLKQPDSALICLQLAYEHAVAVNYNRYLGSTLLNIARVYEAKNQVDSAREYFRRGLKESAEHGYFRGVVAIDLALAEICKQSGQPDSCLYYIRSGLSVADFLNAPDLLLRSYTALADFYYTKGISDSTVKYQSLIIKINDSLFNKKQVQQFQNIDFDQQQRELEQEASEKAYRYRLRMYGLLTGLGIILLVAIILWRNNRHKQRAYTLIIKQKQETDFQKAKVEATLAELRSAQSQLIQSEKMASLGEMAAGIAHEIQNPLNFVNNFSEVSNELLDEMKQELAMGNREQATTIADDVKQNLEKILFHGKRADGIVKNMLQHSLTSAGKKEPTDINALCDEYLRLAYHGMRAKDKSFHAHFETSFDESIGKINIIPQDIGRVVLNLVNNAFYAVNEKKLRNPENYTPLVTVSTKKSADKVLIRVTDNGIGIPKAIKEKIFQPFFTTKPTGSGTGLGLSLSYDIVKAHGGELKAESEEGVGTEFIITLTV
jgi:signal transduction histidine kinase